ncbi:MAG TPA: hypothetical protein VLA97_03440 [Nocardioidaceae bacterium]|nr:hypothetical protein [Nocardioidaceae bacterium]
MFSALVIAVGVVLVRGDDTVIRPPAPSPSATGETTTREDQASELLARLEDGLGEGDRRAVLGLAASAPSARRSLQAIYGNVQTLDIEDLSLRYVDEVGGKLTDADRRTLGRRAWVGEVELSWRLGRYDKGRNEMEVAFTFVDTGDGVAFGSAGGPYDHGAPLWLLDDLALRASGRTLVMAADPGDLEKYSALAVRAVTDVNKVLPSWRDDLVVEVPGSQPQMERVLDAKPSTYGSIAAVTSTVDGSARESAPAHIVVNPVVFGRLGADGAQIVMSHEATHVATDAAISSMPIWLLEGFADYVALAHVDLPVSVTASQILSDVRRKGAPTTLPGAEEFDPANQLLGASYESAWLACRLLGERYGERKLIAFYEAVDDGMSVDEAFPRLLGTSEREFTREWRAYLEELAS